MVAEGAYYTARLSLTDPKRFPSSFDKFWGKSEKKRQQSPDEIWSIFNAIIDAAEGQASGG